MIPRHPQAPWLLTLNTFKRHDFIYKPHGGGEAVTVLTPEEIQYPTFSGPRIQQAAEGEGAAEAHQDMGAADEIFPPQPRAEVPDTPQPGHVVISTTTSRAVSATNVTATDRHANVINAIAAAASQSFNRLGSGAALEAQESALV